MREIEIKARVSSLDDLLTLLARRNVTVSKAVKQHDVVYSVPGQKDNAPGSIWLRIRTEDNSTSIFTLKKQFEGGLDSIEHETAIQDSGELESIIELLGFELYSDLTKTRRKAKLGNIEICIDEVEGLGTFIEAEKLVAQDANGDIVRLELWKELESLGVEKKHEVFEGYDVLQRRQTES